LSDSDTFLNSNKAYIQVLNSDGKPKSGEEIPVFFNPSEYSIDKANEFSAGSSGKSSLTQFTKENLQTLTMDLIFDSYEEEDGDEKDVRNLTRKITDLSKIDSEIGAPPIIRFVWGGPVLTGVLTNVKQKFTLFSYEGIPLRATLSITLKEYKSESINTTNKDTDKKSEDKTHLVKKGETLWGIAQVYYNKPTKWKLIANENKINNPRLLQAGSTIKIPKI